MGASFHRQRRSQDYRILPDADITEQRSGADAAMAAMGIRHDRAIDSAT
jgi:hypothetical protein